MITEDTADNVLLRVAVTALNYYPETSDGPAYAFGEELAWCCEPFTDGTLDAVDRDTLTGVIRDTITDPTAHRERLIDVLDLLTEKPDNE